MRGAMRRVILIAAFVLLASSGCARSPQEFKSNAGGFSVMTPVALTEHVQIQPIPGAGAIEMHNFTGETPYRGYVVVYNDYPILVSVSMKVMDPQKILDGAAQRSLTAYKNAKLLHNSKVSLEGHPGREFVCDFDGDKGRRMT